MRSRIQLIRDRLSNQGVRDFEIYAEQTSGINFRIEQQGLDALQREQEIGFALRVFDGARVGFSYGTDFGVAGIDRVIDRAVAVAAELPEDALMTLVATGGSYAGVDNWDASLDGLSFEERVERVKQLERVILVHSPLIKQAHEVGYQEIREEIFLENSKGLSLYHRRSYCCLSAMAVAERRSSSEAVSKSQHSAFWHQLDPDGLGRTTAQQAIEALEGKRMANYRGPIVCTNEVTAACLEVLSASFLGSQVHKHNSYLVGRLGQPVYSKFVTIVDDGLNIRGSSTQPFDGEGCPSRTTVVVERGEVKKFLYDTYWAAKTRTDSTGNAQREEIQSPPSLGVSQFYLQPDEGTEQDLLIAMGDGFLITEVIGMHTADEISGDFSVGVQGQLIKRGQKAGAMRSMAMTGNLHELFNRVVKVGGGVSFFGAIGAPAILVDQVSLSGD